MLSWDKMISSCLLLPQMI